ncbi:hypothetical protein KKH56_01480 [bacterium]|nr:hypothetical protein [bacterium]
MQEVTSEGLLIPKSLLEQCGGVEGKEMLIELGRHSVHIFPVELRPDEIADIAASYVFEHVGDATAVGSPQRERDRWTVPVILSYKQKILGRLVFSLNGDLIPEESDGLAVLRKQADED